MTLTHRISRSIAAVAIGIGLVSMAAVAPAAPASAGFDGFDIGAKDRFDPPAFDQKPCDDDVVKQHICSPDYVASIDTSRSYRTYHRGEKATVFSLYFQNDSRINGPDRLTNSVGADFPILGFEHLAGNSRWDATPDANRHGERWTLTTPDGLDAGEFTAVWVYVSGWDAGRVRLDVNGSWGADCCGAVFHFDHLEPTTANNTARGELNRGSGK